MKNRTKRILSILLAMILIVSTLAACNTAQETKEETKVETETKTETETTEKETEAKEEVKEEEEAEEQSEEPEESSSETATDMMGREVIIPKEVNKIVNIGSVGVLNGFVQLMGYGDKIAHQMPANFTKTDQWKYQPVFSPQITDLPVLEVAREINMEKVLEVDPDIIFTMSKDSVKTLESKGLNVVFLAWTKPEDAKECINLLGTLLKEEDVAKRYSEYFDEMVEKAHEKTKDIEEKKTVIYGNLVEFTQPHIIAEWWIKEAGGISVTDNGREEEQFKYQMEDLLNWDPDIIIASNDGTKKEILEDDKYSSLKAISEDKVYVTPTVAHVWANRTIEQPLMIMWTMHKLYPDIMTREELSEDIHSFYSEFFKYDMTQDEINAIMDQ